MKRTRKTSKERNRNAKNKMEKNDMATGRDGHAQCKMDMKWVDVNMGGTDMSCKRRAMWARPTYGRADAMHIQLK